MAYFLSRLDILSWTALAQKQATDSICKIASIMAGITALLKVIEVFRLKTISRQPKFPERKGPPLYCPNDMNIRIPSAVVKSLLPTRPYIQNGKIRVLVNKCAEMGGDVLKYDTLHFGDAGFRRAYDQGVCGMLDCLHKAPTSTMVSGPSEQIAKVSIDVKDQAISCTLSIPYALHRGQVDRILPHFEALADGRCFPKRHILVASLLRGITVANEGCSVCFVSQSSSSRVAELS